MQVVVTGGGTGGHVYPALAVVAALRSLEPGLRVQYLGSAGGMEEAIVRRHALPFTAIQASAVRGRGPLGLVRGIGQLALGLGQSLTTMRRLQPDVILATGGYVCVPVVLAGWLLGVPAVIYLPDVEPGWAIRMLAPLAWRTAVTSAISARALLGARVVETGYPVRPALRERTRAVSRARLRLPEDDLVLLVAGGSRGARSINEAVIAGAVELTAQAVVLHIGGVRDADWLAERHRELPEPVRMRYHLYPYLHEEFADALAAADLVVSRAGASVLGEYPAVGLPSVLIPYPYAGAHQRQNARLLADAGAAIELADRRIGELVSIVSGLLADRERLAAMAAAARRLARPDAADRIASLVWAAARRTEVVMADRPGQLG